MFFAHKAEKSRFKETQTQTSKNKSINFLVKWEKFSRKVAQCRKTIAQSEAKCQKMNGEWKRNFFKKPTTYSIKVVVCVPMWPV